MMTVIYLGKKNIGVKKIFRTGIIDTLFHIRTRKKIQSSSNSIFF